MKNSQGNESDNTENSGTRVKWIKCSLKNDHGHFGKCNGEQFEPDIYLSVMRLKQVVRLSLFII